MRVARSRLMCRSGLASMAGRGRRVGGAAAVFGLSAAITSCGTDVHDLLRADAEMAWQAEEAMAAAREQDPAMATPVENAEAEKVRACSDITDAVQREIRGAEGAEEDDILNDIGEFVTRVLPVGPVEDCADAQERYQESIHDLERRLEAMDTVAGPPV